MRRMLRSLLFCYANAGSYSYVLQPLTNPSPLSMKNTWRISQPGADPWGRRGAIAPLDGCWPKNRDAKPIKIVLSVPECTKTELKINHHRPKPHPSRTSPSAPQSSRLRRSTRLAPSALDLGAYGASIRSLATPSGSALAIGVYGAGFT